MTSESVVQKLIRLDAAYGKNNLWRNNSGVLFDATGRPVRYGLANDSKELNDHIKSSDLIGYTQVMITLDMVGQVLPVMTAIECKPSDWTFPRPTNKAEYARCSAQARFHDIILKAGGFAGFATCVEVYRRLIRRG